MGAGHVPGALVPAIAHLARAMPVVLASRVPGGAVFTRTYAFPGSEIDLARHGLIPAGWLSPHKARLLLAVLLGAGLEGDELKAAFGAHARDRKSTRLNSSH